MKQFKLLNIRIDNLSKIEIEEQFTKFCNSKKLNHIATVNPEFLVNAQKDDVFKSILNTKTSLNICDGSGISLWSKILYKTKITRIPGVEIAELLCKVAAQEGKSIYFIGGFGVAKKASQVMKKKFPSLKIAGFEDGEKDLLSTKIIQSKPNIILVAFGAPAQEIWIQKFATQVPSLHIAGGFGGTFDFWAGKIPRAPNWMQKCGIEWLYRLLKEPFKRGKRIFNAVIVFSWLVVKEKFSK